METEENHMIEGISVNRRNVVVPDRTELYQRFLPDIVGHDLDIFFVNLCPNLYSVHVAKHYATPGNHFWACVHESGFSYKLLKPHEDVALLANKIGSVNMFKSPMSKNVQQLSFSEVKEAQENLSDLIFQYKPKIVAFNGKSVFEVYTGKSIGRDFNFGKQPNNFDNDTNNSFMYVLPSSEAKSSKLLPRQTDKLPFYIGLKKFQIHLNGSLGNQPLSDLEIMFPNFQLSLECNKEEASDSDENSPSILDQNNKRTIHRLNNLPFSRIPADILESFESLRKERKEVSILTTASCYHGYHQGKSKKEIPPIDMMIDSGELSVTELPIKTENNIAEQITIQPKLVQVVNKVLIPNTSFQNVPTTIYKKLQPKPSVINLSSHGNSTLKQILSAPVNMHGFRNIAPAAQVNMPNINVVQNGQQNKPTVISHYGQPLKLTDYKIVQRTQTINEKVTPTCSPKPTTVTAATLDNLAKIQRIMNDSQFDSKVASALQKKNAKSSPKTPKILGKPKKIPTTNVTASSLTVIAKPVESKKVPDTENPGKKVPAHIEPSIVQTVQPIAQPIVQQIPEAYLPDENISYMAYELLFQDNYTPSEYYTFNDNSSKQSEDDHVKMLNQLIDLHYHPEQGNFLGESVPRYFSDLKEAERVVLNSSDEERQGMVDFLRL